MSRSLWRREHRSSSVRHCVSYRKKRFGDEQWKRGGEPRSQLPWRSTRGRGLGGPRSGSSGSRLGSDEPSWRKEQNSLEEKRAKLLEEEEVTSPLKEVVPSSGMGVAKKVLFQEHEDGGTKGVMVDVETEKKWADMNSAMQSESKKGMSSPGAKNVAEGKCRFKRLPRSPTKVGQGKRDVVVEKKRGRGGEEVDMDVDDLDRALKIGKMSGALEGDNGKKAGPANQSCENQ